MTLKCDSKFKEKLTSGLKKDIRNLFNFDASSRKPENLQIDGLFLSEVYNFLDKKKKSRRVMSHDTEK